MTSRKRYDNQDAAGEHHRQGVEAGAECLEAALAYRARGWSALAVCPPDHVGVGSKHGKKCKNPGKAPWGEWKEFQERLPTEAELRQKWRDNPQLNVGMALCGVTGLVGLDVDEAGGEELLVRLSAGDLPDTLEFTSGKGRRILYRVPAGVELRPTPQPGGLKVENGELRLLGHGSQTVMPPSRHRDSGRRYAWVPGHGPDEIEAAPAPEWVVALMRADKGNRKSTARGQVAPLADGEKIREHHRNCTLTSLAGTMRRRGMGEEAIRLALLAENAERCDPPLDEEEVAGIAHSVAKYPPGDTRPVDGKGTEQTRGKPTILITTAEHDVNDQAIAALAADPTLYHRGGMLARILADDPVEDGGIHWSTGPRIDPLPRELLRERLAAAAYWAVEKGDAIVIHRPPGWCIGAVYMRGQYPSIRRLYAVVEHPVLRPDGTILTSPGYDASTGLYLACDKPMSLPDRPTLEDAKAAAGILLEVVQDFPFASEAHRSAWLAALLTPLARFAFEGPAPLFLVDANVRGSGKGLLLDCICIITTGKRFTVATYTDDQNELRKRITSLAIAGERTVLLDNLEGRFGNAVLDAALTATSWDDRLLGVNRIVRAPLVITWYATGNNVAVHADTARRICHVRLESPLEQPELRSDFKNPELLRHVADRRDELLAAALTILRAYCLDGRPRQVLSAWGSFMGWSDLVRAAVVWCGLPDPAATRMQMQERSDVTAEYMGVLIECWEHLDPDRHGLTASEAIDTIKKYTDRRATEPTPAHISDLKDVIEAMVGKLDPKALGYKLRSYRRRNFGGKYLDVPSTLKRAARWAVYHAHEFSTGQGHPHHPRHVHPQGGEDGEHGEDVPRRTESEAEEIVEWTR